MPAHIVIDNQAISEFCRKWQITELALFGSVLRDDFRSDSDIDVLVTFEEGADVGMLELVRMARELAGVFDRKVDVVEKAGLRPMLRAEVLSSSEVLYAA
ncbi:MAG: nucleotidyltransferase family protein [Candidatus Sericytochromatia bacterium]|nr:nucleotidyltransferase family protein [Candidatus Sericytochromatia bacterium]